MANWLTKLFKPHESKEKLNLWDYVSMKGSEPSFSSFGASILYSDLVLSAIRLQMRFFGKLEPRHIRNTNGSITSVNDSSITKVLKNPNEYQTTYDFLTQAYFMRKVFKNCYIFADYFISNEGVKTFTGLYILLPMQQPRIVDDNGKLKICFTFAGYDSEVVFDYEDIIIWKEDIEDNQFLGGGKYSAYGDKDLLSSLDAYHQIKQSITEASKLGCTFDGIMKVNAFAGADENTQKIRDKFIADLKANKSGIGVLDNGAEYEPIQRQLKMVDATTMKEIKENLLIHTGVTIEMLEGKFTNEDKEALYENWIEPAAISLGQAMSKVFFSQWQMTHGDSVILYPHKVQLMATSEIVSIITSTISAGVFKIDEYREMLGYAPLENGEGEARPRGFNNLDGDNTNGGVENEKEAQ